MTSQPLILAIETSSRLGSVALALGPDLLDHQTFSGPLRHTAELLPTVRSLLTRSGYRPEQIDQLHLATGPGSFTGLRIAVAMAKAMALAAGPDLRIVTVDTLDVIAANVTDDIAQAHNTKNLAPVLDAKRTQFFTALYHLDTTTDDGRRTMDDTRKKIDEQPSDPAKTTPGQGAIPSRSEPMDKQPTPPASSNYERRNTKYDTASNPPAPDHPAASYHPHAPSNPERSEGSRSQPRSNSANTPASQPGPHDARRTTHDRKVVKDCLLTAAQIIDQFKPPAETLHICGDGLLHHRKKFDVPGVIILPESLWSPTAMKVYELGWRKVTDFYRRQDTERDTKDQIGNTSPFTPPLDLSPFYLRRPEAEEKYIPK